MSKKFLIINGPNLNCLGKREPHIYGKETLDDIKEHTERWLKKNSLDTKLEWFQSNFEGAIVEKIQQAVDDNFNFLIINPGALSHTSIAILDALKLFSGVIIEVHLSNTNAREKFRGKKITARSADRVIEGFGKESYRLAIQSQLMD